MSATEVKQTLKAGLAALSNGQLPEAEALVAIALERLRELLRRDAPAVVSVEVAEVVDERTPPDE